MKRGIAMQIAIIAAGGRVGRLVTKVAVERGHQVTAFVRTPKNTKAQNEVLIDAEDLTKEDLANFDVVVNAFGAWEDDLLPKHDTVTQIICDAISGTDTKLYIVGSAGSLFVNQNHDEVLWESDLMPEPFKPLASNMAQAFNNLKKRSDVNWVYVSPALDFQAEGEEINNYIIAGDDFTTNDNGESFISYADFAVALVDIIEENKFNQERISLLSQ